MSQPEAWGDTADPASAPGARARVATAAESGVLQAAPAVRASAVPEAIPLEVPGKLAAVEPRFLGEAGPEGGSVPVVARVPWAGEEAARVEEVEEGAAARVRSEAPRAREGQRVAVAGQGLEALQAQVQAQTQVRAETW